jgi:DNA-binding Lrp family transcriptional regulator
LEHLPFTFSWINLNRVLINYSTIIMGQALILVVLASTFKSETLEKIRKIPGVAMAHLLYGPYDLFATIKVDTLAEMRAAVIKIRETDGIKSTITCNVIKQP